MNYYIKILLVVGITCSCSKDISHLKNCTKYAQEDIDRYEKYAHGPDGAYFIDRYLKEFLSQSKDKVVLDVGCGCGHWLTYAADNEAKKVYGIDIQQGMVDKAKEIIKKSKYPGKIEVKLADAVKLPYKDNSVDKIISVLVACNIPKSCFEKHFKEMHRVLKKDGEAFVVAPTSLEVLFLQDDVDEHDVLVKINESIKKLGINPTSSDISDAINHFYEILSATFSIDKNKKIFFVDDINSLKEGQPIWKKISMTTLPNYYHSINTYERTFAYLGFSLNKSIREHFASDIKREEFNTQEDILLGKAYDKHVPFVIYYLSKK